MSGNISNLLDAGYPVLYLQTKEQERATQYVIDDLRRSGLHEDLQVFVWKITTGLTEYSATDGNRLANDFMDTLKHISEGQDGQPYSDRLYLMYHIKEMLQAPGNRQKFIDTAYDIRTAGSHIICIGASIELPEELEELVTFVDFDMPTKDEIKKIFKQMATKYSKLLEDGDGNACEVTEDDLDRAAENAMGMSAIKAENAIARTLVETRGIDLELIRDEKKRAVKQSGVIEYIDHSETLETLGGFDVLKAHAAKRQKYYRNVDTAQEYGLKPPKGLMMVGLPGTGKTLAGKAISAALELPLYVFNMGAVFKGVVGQSEATVRNALKLAESVAPCVLLFDEFEKGMAGSESSGKTDSGVTSRVISQMLTWMQETTAPIYKVATCNSVTNLDAALFRRGRWDEIFAVDLPASGEREAIFAIHIAKCGRKPEDFDLEALAEASDNFVGAEIEAVVHAAMFNSFDEDRELKTEDMLEECKMLVPISKTDKESVEQFRRWMKDRACPVSAERVSAPRDRSERRIRHATSTGIKGDEL